MPPMGQSLVRGIITVGSQPALLVLPFLVVGASWLGLVALGLETSPAVIVTLLGLPPVGTYTDVQSGLSIAGLNGRGMAFALALVVVRGLLLAAMAGMAVQVLESGRAGLDGARRGLRVAHLIVAMNIFCVGLILIATIFAQVLGAGLSFLGSVVALVGGLFFFAFVPAAAIREGRGITETFQRSGRLAMMPGGRHLLMAGLYFVVALPVANSVASGAAPGISANPSVGVWIFGLVMAFFSTVFMAAFCYRWIVAEPEIPDEPIRRRR